MSFRSVFSYDCHLLITYRKNELTLHPDVPVLSECVDVKIGSWGNALTGDLFSNPVQILGHWVNFHPCFSRRLWDHCFYVQRPDDAVPDRSMGPEKVSLYP